MLDQIEVAFAERAATEEKLRRFLADASHELRTPLTSIRGYAELFHRGAKDDPEDLDTAMRRIEEESRRMGVMVDELLLLARLGEGRQPERLPVDLARVVADAVGDARAADAGRAISLESPEELVVTGDEHQLRQVVANLLGNARKHTPPDCPVHVRLRAEDGEAGAAGQAVLEVADEGPGLDARGGGQGVRALLPRRQVAGAPVGRRRSRPRHRRGDRRGARRAGRAADRARRRRDLRRAPAAGDVGGPDPQA